MSGSINLRKRLISRVSEFCDMDLSKNFTEKNWISQLQLDSVAFFHLLLFIEEGFGFTFEDDAFNIEFLSDFENLLMIVEKNTDQTA